MMLEKQIERSNNVEKTNRGISIFNFKDSYGHMCSIQKSSSASEPRIWFGMDNPEIIVNAEIAAEEKVSKYPYLSVDAKTNARMHLNQE